MTIFCVKDGDICGVVYNFPLKKVVPRPAPGVVEPQFIKTSNPNVVIDRRTGKMETKFSEPEVELPSPIPFQQTSSPGSDLIPPGCSSWPISFEQVPLEMRHAFHNYLLKSRRKSVDSFEARFKNYIYRCDENDCWTLDDLNPREQFTIEESSKLVKAFEQIYKSDFFKGKFRNP